MQAHLRAKPLTSGWRPDGRVAIVLQAQNRQLWHMAFKVMRNVSGAQKAIVVVQQQNLAREVFLTSRENASPTNQNRISSRNGLGTAPLE